MTFTKHLASFCPVCSKLLDCSMCIDEDDAVPEPGNGSICAGCGAFLVYEEGLSLRLATQSERQEMEDHIKNAYATNQH